MKPPSQWGITDLEALIGQEETSSLEFKDARSLLNEDKKKDEIAKDVSAMANAAGGVIVYGIGEDSKGLATRLAPIENRKGLVEWLEQVIANNIEPKVQGVLIHPIKLPEDKVAIAVEVPKATSLAPHQSTRQSQYFRRWNRTIQAMLDHEVRDLMRRGNVPEPVFELEFDREYGDLFNVKGLLTNLGQEPSLYTFVQLRVDARLSPATTLTGWEANQEIFEDEATVVFRRSWIVPHTMPIMNGIVHRALEDRWTINEGEKYYVTFSLSCPGYIISAVHELTRVGEEIGIRVVD